MCVYLHALHVWRGFKKGKNNSDQTCSCPRDWRLSASWGPNGVPISNPSDHHSTIVMKDLRGALNWSPILP